MTRAPGWRFPDMGRRLERALHVVDLLRTTLVRAARGRGGGARGPARGRRHRHDLPPPLPRHRRSPSRCSTCCSPTRRIRARSSSSSRPWTSTCGTCRAATPRRSGAPRSGWRPAPSRACGSPTSAALAAIGPDGSRDVLDTAPPGRGRRPARARRRAHPPLPEPRAGRRTAWGTCERHLPRHARDDVRVRGAGRDLPQRGAPRPARPRRRRRRAARSCSSSRRPRRSPPSVDYFGNPVTFLTVQEPHQRAHDHGHERRRGRSADAPRSAANARVGDGPRPRARRAAAGDVRGLRVRLRLAARALDDGGRRLRAHRRSRRAARSSRRRSI